MIDQMKANYPVSVLCEVMELSRSTYYHRGRGIVDDPAVVSAIEHILMRYPFYGYRRVHAQLKREGIAVSQRVVRRILKDLGGSRQVGKVRINTTDSRHGLPRYPNRIKSIVPGFVNHIWVADITYIRFGKRFIFLAVILDAFSRAIRGWHLSRSIELSLTLTALQNALAIHPAPVFFHSDQGSQYAAHAHTRALLAAAVQNSMSAVGQPTDNAIVERFIRTFKEEHVDYADYDSFDDACRQIQHWLEVEYMTERIHSSLDYATPAEFEAAALQLSPSFCPATCPIF
jgi:transposase InsO family protein